MSYKLKDVISNIPLNKLLEEAKNRSSFHKLYLNDFYDGAYSEGERYWRNFDYEKNDRFIDIPLFTWCCTDTQVGYILYFFDDELVCVSQQQYRKGETEYYWKDRDSWKKVKDYIESLDTSETPDIDPIYTFEDFDKSFHFPSIKGDLVEYSGNITSKVCYTENEKWNIINTNPDNNIISTLITIEKDGISKTVDIKNVLIPFDYER